MKNDPTKVSLQGLTLDEMRRQFVEVECDPEIASRVAYWVYRRRVTDVNAMVDLNKAARQLIHQHFTVKPEWPVSVMRSDDGTKKYLFRFSGKRLAESALMPEGRRTTLCISTQSGCRMGCAFCNTATLGFGGNLSAREMVMQLLAIEEWRQVNHLVLMGMGEPFDNLDEVLSALHIFTSNWGFSIAKRFITVSTVGLLPGLNRFVKETPYNLAISLHSPFPSEREWLMPSERVAPILITLDYLKANPFPKKRRLTFEYLLLEGFNNSRHHALEITRLLRGIPCQVNLIPFNSFAGSPFRAPSATQVMDFRDLLDTLGQPATIRKSRGADIQAACGLLAGNCPDR